SGGGGSWSPAAPAPVADRAGVGRTARASSIRRAPTRTRRVPLLRLPPGAPRGVAPRCGRRPSGTHIGRDRRALAQLGEERGDPRDVHGGEGVDEVPGAGGVAGGVEVVAHHRDEAGGTPGGQEG